MKIYSLLLLLCSVFALSCGNEIAKPYAIDVESQEDVDLICSLVDNGVFEGVFRIATDEALDFSCFTSIREVTRSVVTSCNGCIQHLVNLERVGEEGFFFCDPQIEHVNFPKLRFTAGGVGVSTDCTHIKTVNLPVLEEAFWVFFTTFSGIGESKLESFTGCNLLKECAEIIIDSEQDDFVLDGFRNLESASNIDISVAGNNLNIKDGSFGKLRKANRIWFRGMENSHFDFTALENLTQCDKLVAFGDFSTDDFCPLVPLLNSGAITSASFSSITTEALIDICE